MTEHALLSPSDTERWVNCPGSLWAGKELPDTDSDTKFSEAGATAHALAEYCLKNNKPADALLGMKTVANDIDVDEEMAEAVQIYLDTIKGIKAGMQTIYAFEVEQKLDFTYLLDVDAIKAELGADTTVHRAFGTADVIILGDGVLQVHDLKYGKGIKVSAENNKQLLTYALAAYHYYSLACNISKISVHIHQPRLDAYSEFSVTPNELLEFGDFLKEKQHQAYRIYVNGPSDASDFCPGVEQCRFCRASGGCNALSAQVAEAVGTEISLVDETTIQNLGVCGNEELAAKYRVLDLVSIWIKAVKAEVTTRLNYGQHIPGYKLVLGRQGNMAWRDTEEAEKLLKSFRLKHGEMYVMKLISPTQALKVLKDSPKRREKLDEIITRADAKPTIAPETDKKPAISIADDFTDLTQEDN